MRLADLVNYILAHFNLTLRKKSTFDTLISLSLAGSTESAPAKECGQTDVLVSPGIFDNDRLEEEELFEYEGGCDAIWTAVLIKSNGDVYPCCYSQIPALKLGNIREMQFEDIWLSNRAEQLREYSRADFMPCPSCLAPQWRKVQTEFNIPDKLFRSKPTNLHDIVRIQAEPSQFCSGRCIMCELDVTDKAEIDYEVLAAIIKQANPRLIHLVGGEVFCAPNIDSFLSWLYDFSEQTKSRIAMISNGAIPKKRITELVDFYYDFKATFLGTTREIEKAVSGLDLDRKIDFVKSLIQVRNKNRLKEQALQAVDIVFTIVPTNFHQIPDIVGFAEDIGADHLFFNFDYFLREFINRYPSLFEQVRHNLEKAIQRPRKIRINTLILRELGLTEHPGEDGNEIQAGEFGDAQRYS